jgi:UDP-perosamine 4-acetyltransferase
VILGGGGHAKVLIDCLKAERSATPVAVLDSDSKRWKTELLGVPILGNDDFIPALIENKGVNCFAVGVGSVGDNSTRQKLFALALKHSLLPHTIIHPTANCSLAAEFEHGAQLLAGCIVNAGARVGQNTIINTGAIVEHDARIGAHVHIATGARLCGGVTVGEGVFVGAGATVIQGVSIGAGAIVGAGAVVLDDIAAGETVVGVPAKKLR